MPWLFASWFVTKNGSGSHRERVCINVSLASNPFKAPGVLCRSKESFLHYSSRLISSIRLSGCLYEILAIRAVLFWLIVCSWGDTLGTWAGIRLTFVFLLDVCIAQAHQSHLEAENSHFAITSTSGKKEKKNNKKVVRLQFMNSEWSQIMAAVINSYIGWALLGGTTCGGITWVKAVQYRSVQQCEIVLELSCTRAPEGTPGILRSCVNGFMARRAKISLPCHLLYRQTRACILHKHTITYTYPVFVRIRGAVPSWINRINDHWPVRWTLLWPDLCLKGLH